MVRGKDLTTEADIDAAIERSKEFDKVPRAESARYEATVDVIVIQLSNGHRFLIPREELAGLESASAVQLSEIEIHAGLGLSWPQLDVDHYLPYLLEQSPAYGRFMDQFELGRVKVAA